MLVHLQRRCISWGRRVEKGQPFYRMLCDYNGLALFRQDTVRSMGTSVMYVVLSLRTQPLQVA
jgi:hypothetical protein